MQKPIRSNVSILILSALCAALSLGCASQTTQEAAATPAAPAAVQPTPAPAPAPTPPAPPPNKPSDAVHWYRDSAEQRAIYIETYRAALQSVKKHAKGLRPGKWAVILDVDETVLDNSDYQKSLGGGPYDPKLWEIWVNEAAATALPGAQEFTDKVLHELHGQVVLVTNRADKLCTVTETNLHSVRIAYSRILCDEAGDGDKNGRFELVAKGDGAHGPLKIVAWVGDNIKDFPNLSQAAPGKVADYGVKYFVLPNPMYGSWMSVPAR
jgi:5'-nucleotidase (lipoprotein e(P4) family)